MTISSYADMTFNDSGKFPTDSDFWKMYSDRFTAGDGITNGFSTVMGEQVFRPLGDVRTPFYNRFAGRPLNVGDAFKERALFKIQSRHFKPKATAEDDLGFTDSEGLEVVYPVNVEGWIKTSIPSSLKTVEMMLKDGEIGQLSSMLVDNVLKTYQRDTESAIQKKVVSSIGSEETIDFSNGVNAWKMINKLGIRMKGEKYHYNALTDAQNEKIMKQGGKILCFIDAEVYEDMIGSFAVLPSPDYINKDVEFIPMVDGMPTPITTEEFNAGTGTDAGGSAITWTGEPVAIDESQPTAILMCDSAVEYRPVMGTYRINMSKNNAGDFENEHLLWKASIKVSPFEDMIRLNNA